MLEFYLIVTVIPLIGVCCCAFLFYFLGRKRSYTIIPWGYDKELGLLNLSAFKVFVEYCVSTSTNLDSKMAILMVDFSGAISELNQEDRKILVKECVDRIKSTLRFTDLLSWFDKYKIVAFLPRVFSYKDVEGVAQRIISCFEQPFLLRGMEHYLNVNIGIVVYPDDGRDIDVLLKNADSVVIKSQGVGVNDYYFFNEELNEKNQKFIATVRELKEGLKDDQFVLYYQPLYSMKKGTFIGVEALLRWNHPQRGLLSPADFISLAESSGLIEDIGYWVIDRACKDYISWGRPPLNLSVNLSAKQFLRKDLAFKICDILNKNKMNPMNLTLEITETASMSDIQYSLKVLSELRRIGFLISIDDFGAGYSSLAYLRQFPVTSLKIDASFTRDIGNGYGEVVIKTIIDLAKSLNLSVVVEGVETEEQLRLLSTLGCDIVQGYFIAPPLPSDKLLVYLDKRIKELVV